MNWDTCPKCGLSVCVPIEFHPTLTPEQLQNFKRVGVRTYQDAKCEMHDPAKRARRYRRVVSTYDFRAKLLYHRREYSAYPDFRVSTFSKPFRITRGDKKKTALLVGFANPILGTSWLDKGVDWEAEVRATVDVLKLLPPEHKPYPFKVVSRPVDPTNWNEFIDTLTREIARNCSVSPRVIDHIKRMSEPNPKNKMNIEETLNSFVEYFDKTRGCGHTKTMLDGARNMDCLVIAANEDHAAQLQQLIPEEGSRRRRHYAAVSGRWSILNKLNTCAFPMVFDNFTLRGLFADATKCIRELRERLDNVTMQANGHSMRADKNQAEKEAAQGRVKQLEDEATTWKAYRDATTQWIGKANEKHKRATEKIEELIREAEVASSNIETLQTDCNKLYAEKTELERQNLVLANSHRALKDTVEDLRRELPKKDSWWSPSSPNPVILNVNLQGVGGERRGTSKSTGWEWPTDPNATHMERKKTVEEAVEMLRSAIRAAKSIGTFDSLKSYRWGPFQFVRCRRAVGTSDEWVMRIVVS